MPSGDGDAVDLLEGEDLALIELFGRLQETAEPCVPVRYAHGIAGKQLVRRIAVREAAKADVVHALRTVAPLTSVKNRLIGDIAERRAAMR